MKELYRKVLTIILAITVMAILFALPGFAETQDELKDRFVTRASWSEWIHSNCGLSEATDTSHHPIGMSEYLEGIESVKFRSIYSRVGTEMSLRGMKLKETE